MSSWAQDMYDMGYTSELGGLMNGSDRSYNRRTSSTKKDTKSSINQNWFATAQEAQDYAKKNIGVIITRSPDGNGYIVKI